jgi:hypothetical protein
MSSPKVVAFENKILVLKSFRAYMVISKASSENNATVEINNLEYKKTKL